MLSCIYKVTYNHIISFQEVPDVKVKVKEDKVRYKLTVSVYALLYNYIYIYLLLYHNILWYNNK